jgi:hypothetical protein
MKRMLRTFPVFLIFAPFIGAQSKPTQAEITQWKKEPSVLESSVCKKITWLLENERGASTELTKQPVRYALGWWGRGFIEGAVMSDENAQKKASDFGLSVDVVAAHISTYCYSHQADRPIDAVQDLLLKVLK